MTELTWLHLDSNTFTGNLITGACVSGLWYSANLIFCAISGTLPSEWGEMKRIMAISMIFNDLSGMGLEYKCEGTEKLIALRLIAFLS